MRSLAVSVLMLAACASTPALPPDDVRGCWIERSSTTSGGAATMRWFPDPDRPEVMVGNYLAYSGTGATQPRVYTLTRGEPWRFCHVLQTGGERCWDVAHGDSGSLAGGRVFIDFQGRRMRISILDGATERVVFNGVRDGCD